MLKVEIKDKISIYNTYMPKFLDCWAKTSSYVEDNLHALLTLLSLRLQHITAQHAISRIHDSHKHNIVQHPKSFPNAPQGVPTLGFTGWHSRGQDMGIRANHDYTYSNLPSKSQVSDQMEQKNCRSFEAFLSLPRLTRLTKHHAVPHALPNLLRNLCSQEYSAIIREVVLNGWDSVEWAPCSARCQCVLQCC